MMSPKKSSARSSSAPAPRSLRFVSTRAAASKEDQKKEKQSTQNSASFTDAVFEGLAPGGGLYYPDHEPDLSAFFRQPKDIPAKNSAQNKNSEKKSASPERFAEFAARCTEKLFFDEFTPEQAAKLCARAFDFEPVLKELDEHITMLELFHGPSCAFKDFGASYLAAVMEHRAAAGGKPVTVLTATSGDTGSAVAQAFYKKENIRVVILYPSARVSPLQEKQLTTLGENITALEVSGSFDDCQRMVKEAFSDPGLKERYRLTSANSINIGRLIPQAFYYMHAWRTLARENAAAPPPLFCVPSGNFGNLTAGLLAWRWGMGVRHFLAATNENKAVPEYLHSGIYIPRASIPTLANAMDVGDPSNFERMKYLFASIDTPMRDVVAGQWVTDADIAATIKKTRESLDYFLCPHTAAGLCAARRMLADAAYPYKRAVVLATAHPGKFSEVIEQACGVSPPLPERLAVFLKKQKRSVLIDAKTSALSDVLAGL